MKYAIPIISTGVLAAAILTASVGGCDSDLPPPSRQAGAGGRTMSDLSNVSDPDHEYLAAQPDAVPLLEVDLSNKKGGAPRVRTIVDALKPATTLPATPTPTTGRPQPMHGTFDTTLMPATLPAPATQP